MGSKYTYVCKYKHAKHVVTKYVHVRFTVRDSEIIPIAPTTIMIVIDKMHWALNRVFFKWWSLIPQLVRYYHYSSF